MLQMSRLLSVDPVPSAFHVQYGGCAGVVCVDPTLTSDTIQVRGSMEHFRSKHNGLEVVHTTRPETLYTSRQVPNILHHYIIYCLDYKKWS